MNTLVLRKITIFTEEATLIEGGFHTGPLSWSIRIWRCWFFGGRKIGEPRENTSEQCENQKQTYPHTTLGQIQT